jgi:SAM-dependent methyltransferase
MNSLQLAWDLAPSPYGDRFMASKAAAIALRPSGISLVICSRCSLVQLVQDVDAVEVYSEYLYHSSVTVGLASYYTRLARYLVSELAMEKDALVVDIGSNDGTGLLPYRHEGMRVAGIEPSKSPAQAASARGIPTINSFLNEESTEIVRAEHGLASLVCANYVAANVPDPVTFLLSMKSLLNANGAISILTGYHPDQFALNMFEYVNHDHLTYLTVKSAAKLAELAGLHLISATRVEHKGGSLHLLLRPQGSTATADESIMQLQQREAWMGIESLGYYAETAERIALIGVAVRSLLQQLENSSLAGVGASISTTHLLHQFSIGHSFSRLFDDDPNKIGRYSPGFGIEVSRLDDLGKGDWDTAVLLAWQHSSKLVSRIQETQFKGNVLIPLPRPTLVEIG